MRGGVKLPIRLLVAVATTCDLGDEAAAREGIIQMERSERAIKDLC